MTKAPRKTTTAKRLRKPKKTVVLSANRQLNLRITLPRDIADRIEEELKSRGSDFHSYVRMHLMAFKTTNVMIKLFDPLNFGKYSGVLCEEVVRNDPKYITWLMEVSTSKKFAPEVYHLVDQLSCRHDEIMYDETDNWGFQ